mmetsp:Transcript_26601/g.37454  ORF Transcript_26601/g.37454 Transcript_26601/m.37454 type:complete len:240 (-) Transcript_26601:71-790(-)
MEHIVLLLNTANYSICRSSSKTTTKLFRFITATIHLPTAMGSTSSVLLISSTFYQTFNLQSLRRLLRHRHPKYERWPILNHLLKQNPQTTRGKQRTNHLMKITMKILRHCRGLLRVCCVRKDPPDEQLSLSRERSTKPARLRWLSLRTMMTRTKTMTTSTQTKTLTVAKVARAALKSQLRTIETNVKPQRRKGLRKRHRPLQHHTHQVVLQAPSVKEILMLMTMLNPHNPRSSARSLTF